MKNKLDVSWKDFLAGAVGYLVSLLTVGLIMMSIGMLVAKTGDKTIFARYEALIAVGTFAGFFIGGMILGAIRPGAAVRNATVLFLGMMCFGLWKSTGMELSLSNIGIVLLQVIGIIVGAGLMQYRVAKKK